MTENTKYMLTTETLTIDNGVELKRIIALKDFGKVKKGDLGGWVQSEDNLGFEGKAWVQGNARVFGNARVSDDAIVSGNATVRGHAQVYGIARVLGDASVYDDAQVFGYAQVSGYVRVYGRAKVYGKVRVFGDTTVGDVAQVCGHVRISGHVVIGGDAKVTCVNDYVLFKNNWSSGRYFTWTKSNDMWLVGCFYGTGEELIKKAYKDSEESGRKYELYVNLVKELQK